MFQTFHGGGSVDRAPTVESYAQYDNFFAKGGKKKIIINAPTTGKVLPYKD
jgi:hypothetical protein